jgi:hypothetical protein
VLRLEAGRLGYVLRFTVDDTAPDPFEVEAARFHNLTLQAIQCPASYTVVDIDPHGQGTGGESSEYETPATGSSHQYARLLQPAPQEQARQVAAATPQQPEWKEQTSKKEKKKKKYKSVPPQQKALSATLKHDHVKEALLEEGKDRPKPVTSDDDSGESDDSGRREGINGQRRPASKAGRNYDKQRTFSAEEKQK